ncbi:MAG: hypothetical protein IPK04_03495 [Bdellovibrionales bacterium]|nr:hypothetical protein [Bdellovibrionales bacterium]
MSRDSMDPFEEFQFKPLTEGLGFHRKNQKENQKERGLNSLDFENEDPVESAQQFRARGLDLINDEKSLDFRSPLSRQKKQTSEEDALSPTSAAVDEILKTLNHKRPREPLTKGQTSPQAQAQLRKTQAKLQSQGKSHAEQSGLEKCGVNLFAGFLDAMLVAAGTLLGFIVLLTVTQVDLLAQLTKPQDYEIYFASFAVFFGVSIVYYLATRIFLGCTPGEWAYDQELGTKADQSEFSYAFLIIIRTCINLFTGIILLPLISQIANRDIVGQLIGLELYRKS